MSGVEKRSRRDPLLIVPSEHEEQRTLVSWFRKSHPGVRIFAIPNGGARSITTAARLKVEGVMRGVPDLYVPAWNLWIEMKRRKKSSVSSDQKDWHQYLSDIGHAVVIGYGFDDAKDKIEKWFIGTFPTRSDGVEH